MDATLHITQKSGAVLFLRMFAIGILFTVAIVLVRRFTG
jgi:hypothetical protein